MINKEKNMLGKILEKNANSFLYLLNYNFNESRITVLQLNKTQFSNVNGHSNSKKTENLLLDPNVVNTFSNINKIDILIEIFNNFTKEDSELTKFESTSKSNANSTNSSRNNRERSGFINSFERHQKSQGKNTENVPNEPLEIKGIRNSNKSMQMTGNQKSEIEIPILKDNNDSEKEEIVWDGDDKDDF